MTEQPFVTPGERIRAALAPLVERIGAALRPAVARLPDAAKVAMLPLLLLWAVGQGLSAVTEQVYLGLHPESLSLRIAVNFLLWFPGAVFRALLAVMLIVGWLRVVAGLETAAWCSGLMVNRSVLRGWALALLMGAGHHVVLQLLYLLDLVQVGNVGLINIAANLPVIQGLVFVLPSLVAWALVLPLAMGFVPIARGESLDLRRLMARLHGRWWRTAGALVALLALVKVLGWAVNWPLYAAVGATWLRDVLGEMAVLWRIVALLLVASGAAVLERRLPPAPRTIAP